jgi:hypothetical protein
MPNIQLQFRRDTAANWLLHEPTLASGELAIETDSRQFKIGTGSIPWSTLPYGGLQGPTGTSYIPVGIWGSGIPYTKDTVVVSPVDNNTYVSIVSPTDLTTDPSANITEWVILAIRGPTGITGTNLIETWNNNGDANVAGGMNISTQDFSTVGPYSTMIDLNNIDAYGTDVTSWMNNLNSMISSLQNIVLTVGDTLGDRLTFSPTSLSYNKVYHTINGTVTFQTANISSSSPVYISNSNTVFSANIVGPQGPTGSTAVVPGPTGVTGPPMGLGNVLIVDDVNGNDSTASVGGSPYKTIETAINAATSGKTIWVMPGIYNLSAGIVLPAGICLRGLNIQTCIIQMLGVEADTILLTMGESCRVEDLTLKLSSNGHYNLTGIDYIGTTSQTSKLRTCVLTVDNSGSSDTGLSDVCGIKFSGTGSFNESIFSFNSVKGSTVNVKSNGDGRKRGFLITDSNQVSTRDTNIYVASPISAPVGSSYVGIETADPNGIGSIQTRTTSIGAPKQFNTFTSSDILQTHPQSLSNPTYLASAGIQIGPATDLVTKSAGGKPFSTYAYPTTIFYGIKGLLKTSSNNGTTGYCWIGTQAATNGQFPDPTIPAAFYRVQQPAILSGMSINCNVGPGSNHTTTFKVYRTPVNGTIEEIPNFSATLSDSEKVIYYYNSSQDFAAGDLLHLGVVYTGNNDNTTEDISVQLDMF